MTGAVKLKIKDETNRTFNASGVLIGPDLVLTSAHNVRYRGGEDYVSRAVSVKAYIGYHRQNSSSKGVGVQERPGARVIVLQEWESSDFAWHNDMALIKLGSRFTQVKPASYQAPSPGESDVLVVGYPSNNTTQVLNACPDCKTAGCMYEVAGQAKYNAAKLLEYELSTMPGKSPVKGPDKIPQMLTVKRRQLWRSSLPQQYAKSSHSHTQLGRFAQGTQLRRSSEHWLHRSRQNLPGSAVSVCSSTRRNVPTGQHFHLDYLLCRRSMARPGYNPKALSPLADHSHLVTRGEPAKPG